jgi:hypothetical protein
LALIWARSIHHSHDVETFRTPTEDHAASGGGFLDRRAFEVPRFGGADDDIAGEISDVPRCERPIVLVQHGQNFDYLRRRHACPEPPVLRRGLRHGRVQFEHCHGDLFDLSERRRVHGARAMIGERVLEPLRSRRQWRGPPGFGSFGH